MVRISLAFIILLLFISCIYADGILSEEAKRQAKEGQLEQLAAQFKAESGFKGTINFDLDAGVFEQIRGTFPNCEVRDTVEAQTKALLLINELLPYIRIDMDQLTKDMVGSTDRDISVYFRQIIDGLEIEPQPGINVIIRTKLFDEVTINSSLVPDLHFEKNSYLSLEEANNIFKKEIGDLNTKKDYSNLLDSKLFPKLMVSKLYSPEESEYRNPDLYKVCWKMPYRVGFEFYNLYIDAVTGQILGNIKPVPFDDLNLH
ncbi:MAG: hypothetical protein ACE14O_06500 [Candidatus Cloacimonadaceae bacterium]